MTSPSKGQEQLAKELTEASASLPKHGEDFELYSTSKTFQVRAEKLRHVAEECLIRVLGADVVKSEESLLDAIADLREKSHVAYDRQRGFGNVTQKIQAASSASRIPMHSGDSFDKPQVFFADSPVDNTSAPFKPKLLSKPNAIIPLAESLILEKGENLPESLVAHLVSLGKSGAEPFYRNPYEPEIRNALEEHPLKWLWNEAVKFPIRQRVTKKLGHGKGKTNEPSVDSLEAVQFSYVDGDEGFDEMLRHLRNGKHEAIAVDLEHHSQRSYQGFTCLMQISSETRDFVVDTIKLRQRICEMLDVFTNPTIVKVLHGADYDVEWLQKDFGLYVVQMFDTGQAARVLGYESASLAYALERHCKVQANKALQLADWRLRPLTAEMLKYAREDTHFLLGIFDSLRRELLKLGSQRKMDAVENVLERSADIACKAYSKPVCNIARVTEIFNGEQASKEVMTIARYLYEWRDGVARAEDESPEFILSLRGVARLAKIMPESEQQLVKELESIKGSSVILKAKLSELLAVIIRARADVSSFRTAGATKFDKIQPITSSMVAQVSPSVIDAHKRAFYCGINLNGDESEYDPSVREVIEKAFSSASKVAINMQPLRKLSSIVVVKESIGKDMTRVRAVDALIEASVNEEMRTRIAAVETIKETVSTMLNEIAIDAKPIDKEEITSMRERYKMPHQQGKQTSIVDVSTPQDQGFVPFNYTQEVAERAGAIAPTTVSATKTKKKRPSRWNKEGSDDEEVDERKKKVHQTRDDSAGRSQGQEVGGARKNPYILKPNRPGAQSSARILK